MVDFSKSLGVGVWWNLLFVAVYRVLKPISFAVHIL